MIDQIEKIEREVIQRGPYSGLVTEFSGRDVTISAPWLDEVIHCTVNEWDEAVNRIYT